MKKKEIDSSLSNIEIENSHQRLWLIAKIYLNAWRAKAPLNSIKDFLSQFASYVIKSTLICQMFIYLLRMNGRRLGQTINHSYVLFYTNVMFIRFRHLPNNSFMLKCNKSMFFKNEKKSKKGTQCLLKKMDTLVSIYLF